MEEAFDSQGSLLSVNGKLMVDSDQKLMSTSQTHKKNRTYQYAMDTSLSNF